jgi:hypothetical protein
VTYYPKWKQIVVIQLSATRNFTPFLPARLFPLIIQKGSFKPGVVVTIKPEIIPLVPDLDNPSEGKKETSSKAFGNPYRRLIILKLHRI